MRHRDYVTARTAREPRFEAERKAAAPELELSGAIAARRQVLEIPLERLADETGIPMERLPAIEEGESMTVHEALWLLHALDLSARLGADLRITSAPSLVSTVRYVGDPARRHPSEPAV